MGMYDEFDLSQIEMPNLQHYKELFQTKGFDCNLDHFRVTGDGRVMKRINDGAPPLRYEPATKLHGRVALRGPISVVASFYMGQLKTLEMDYGAGS